MPGLFVGYAVLAVSLVGLPALLIVAAVRIPNAHPWQRWIILAIALLFVALGLFMAARPWGTVLIGIYLNESGLRVANHFRSVTVPWGDVAAIDVDLLGFITVRTTAGAEIHSVVGPRRGWMLPSKFDFSVRLSEKTFDGYVAALRAAHVQYATGNDGESAPVRR
jgi:hypothetical protein